jgi:hypothetical protein
VTSLAACGERLKNALFINYFLSLAQGTFDEEEDCLTSSSGVQLTFKCKSKSIEPGDVTAAQWISANATIYDILSVNMSPGEKSQYSDFTKQIGDLLKCTWNPRSWLWTMSTGGMSVKQVAHWTILRSICSVSTCVLGVLIILLMLQNDIKSDKSVSKTTTHKSRKCGFAYNSEGVCKYPDTCKYLHKCSERGCGELHPKQQLAVSFSQCLELSLCTHWTLLIVLNMFCVTLLNVLMFLVKPFVQW